MLEFKKYLTEMAMQTGKGLAAVREGGIIVVFRPTTKLRRAVSKLDAEIMWDNSDDIMGILEVRDNRLYQSMEVERIWAKPGFGPLLYLIGMSAEPDRGLMPTRVKQHISDPAKEVWKQFSQGKGQQYVTPHDAPDAEGNLPQHHDEPFLNKKYIINAPYPEFDAMITRGQRFFADDPYQEKINHFIEFADSYLKHQMDQIYNLD